MSIFSHIEEEPRDPVLGIVEACRADSSPDKVDLSVGVVRTEEGRTQTLQVVREAEQALVAAGAPMDYLPQDGDARFNELAWRLLMCRDGGTNEAGELPALSPKCLAISQRSLTVQALSGTGALYVAAEFLSRYHARCTHVFLGSPTWPVHRHIFRRFEPVEYPLWDAASRGLNFEAALAVLRRADARSVVVLQAVAHNPTGCDFEPSQWLLIKQEMLRTGAIVVLDIAYQGFAKDAQSDAQSVRLFNGTLTDEERAAWASAAEGLTLDMPLDRILDDTPVVFTAQSFAKTFGLYGHRVGALHALLPTPADTRLRSCFKRVCRTTWSNPPRHGAAVVAAVLGKQSTRERWTAELAQCQQRAQKLRAQLREGLEKATGQDWSHVTRQQGMFSYTGLTPAQTKACMEQHLYMLASGRICISGLNQNNMAKVVDIISKVIKNV